jgi:hypothetical protein
LELPIIYSIDNSLETSCVTSQQIECLELAEAEFFNLGHSDNCTSSCPLECHRVDYDTKVSFASYPSRWYSTKLNQSGSFRRVLAKANISVDENITFDYLKQTVLSVNIYYDEMSYIQMDESQKTDMSVVLGLIGGNLGIFVGVSILTLIEFIDLIINIISISIKNSYNRFKNRNL